MVNNIVCLFHRLQRFSSGSQAVMPLLKIHRLSFERRCKDNIKTILVFSKKWKFF